MIGSPKLRYSFLLIIPVIFLTSCATLKPKEIPININLITLDKDLNPIDAVCNLYSSSSKLDILAPNKVVFLTECSSINIVCKSGDLSGHYGLMQENQDTSGEDFIINSGLGYLFDRAVDTVTPMGSLMNIFGADDECVTDREITVVLE